MEVTIRERRLRWPVSEDVDERLPGQTITSVDRRAKYLLINTTGGTAMCWGDNQSGQLGDGTTAGRFAPVATVGATCGSGAETSSRMMPSVGS